MSKKKPVKVNGKGGQPTPKVSYKQTVAILETKLLKAQKLNKIHLKDKALVREFIDTKMIYKTDLDGESLIDCLTRWLKSKSTMVQASFWVTIVICIVLAVIGSLATIH